MGDADAASRIAAEEEAGELLSGGEWGHVVSTLGLSSQQARIVELIVAGKSDKEVAAAMRVRVPTVRTHLGRIFQRTGATDRVALVVRVFTRAREWQQQNRGHQE